MSGSGTSLNTCTLSSTSTNFLKDKTSTFNSSDQECPVHSPGIARLKKLYPYVNIDELPLSWSVKDKGNCLFLSDSNLKVHHKSTSKGQKDAASIRTTVPIPQSCLLYYFEIRVISKGRDGYMGIGLASQNVSLTRLPGWDKHSFGYHGDDGNSFNCSSTGQSYGPTFTSKDVIGCAYNLLENKCFFTKNGFSLGVAFSDMPNVPLYPIIGLQTPGEVVEANFGLEPFVYDIEQDIEALKKRITSSISDFPVQYIKWQSTMHNLIQSWFVHNGYYSTAEKFAAITHKPLNVNATHTRQRLRIQQLILDGKIGEAIAMTERLYPDVLTKKPHLLFALKCRQFIELVAGNDTLPSNTVSSTGSFNSNNTNNVNMSGNNNVASNNVSTPLNANTNANNNDSDLTSGSMLNSSSAELSTAFNSQGEHSNGECNGNSSAATDNVGMEVDDQRAETSDSNNLLIPSSSNSSFNAVHNSAVNHNINSATPSTASLSNTNIINNNANITSITNASNNNNSNSVSNMSVITDDDSPDLDLPTISSDNPMAGITDKQRLEQILAFGRDLHLFSQHLERRFGSDDKNKRLMHNAFSLLAYNDPYTSPLAWQLNPNQREEICLQLNDAIIFMQQDRCCLQPPLELVLSQAKNLLRINGHFGAWLFDSISSVKK